MNAPPRLGTGAGWRPELALAIDRRPDIGFVEVIAESLVHGPSPALVSLHDRGVPVIPHGVSLGPGSGTRLEPARLDALARAAELVDAPFVSEHVAFVRGAGLETGHLLPVPRTVESLDILVENVTAAQAALPVPLVLENIAGSFEWPESTMDDATFLAALVEATGVGLLLDLANLHANAINFDQDALDVVRRMPLENLVYVHVAGGITAPDGFYRDTHAHAVPGPVLDLVEELAAMIAIPGVLLERDDRWPSDAAWRAEMDAVLAAVRRGDGRRTAIESSVGVAHGV